MRRTFLILALLTGSVIGGWAEARPRFDIGTGDWSSDRRGAAASAAGGYVQVAQRGTLDNETVRQVQKLLAELGHDPGGIDGLMGPRTGAAIRAFQEETGERVTGEYSVPFLFQVWDRVARARREAAVTDRATSAALGEAIDRAKSLSDAGRYEEALPYLRVAVIPAGQVFGPNEANTAVVLSKLADLYHGLGEFEDAEPLYRRALDIREQTTRPDDPAVAIALNNLAVFYAGQERHAEAELLYSRALEIQEQSLGPDDPAVATSLANLAMLYHEQGRYAAAEEHFRRALVIRERALGPDHPTVATSLDGLALLHLAHGRHAEAEALLLRALSIRQQGLGSAHPDIAQNLDDLAALYEAKGQDAEAQSMRQRALAIRDQ